MTPWKWNDEINLWVNSVTDETMTATEYDDARCRMIIQLEEEIEVLREGIRDVQNHIPPMMEAHDMLLALLHPDALLTGDEDCKSSS